MLRLFVSPPSFIHFPPSQMRLGRRNSAGSVALASFSCFFFNKSRDKVLPGLHDAGSGRGA